MADDLEGINAEIDKWSGYAATLEREGKQATAEFNAVRARFLDAIATRAEYIAAHPPEPPEPAAPPEMAQFPTPLWLPKPKKGRKPKPQIEPSFAWSRNNCDVRHTFARGGLGPCDVCGAPSPWVPKKQEPDPKITAYKAERARRPDTIAGEARHPLTLVSKQKRMQAVWEAQ